MKTRPIFNTTILALLSTATRSLATITLNTVTVGNPGNTNDTDVGQGAYGGVGYTYNIGTYDVTLTEYAEFLNAVAKVDTYSLYKPSMATNLNIAGIARSGSSGNYSYSVIGSGQRPVTYVSWFDAARFTNWLHNGQPTGLGEVAASTEQGAYTLNGDTTSGLETKNANAQYWIPSENEWYKAAYYDPNKGGPGVSGYWLYPTRSDTTPGNVMGSGTNQANCRNSNLYFSVTQTDSYSSTQNYLTDVGIFANSASAYGTYDQGGDVFQWNDAVIFGDSRGLRGGSWSNYYTDLLSSFRSQGPATDRGADFGFRVATVPEPSVGATLLLAGGALLAVRRRQSGLRPRSSL